MAVANVDEDLRVRFQAVAAPEEDWNVFVTEATRAMISRREQREEIRRHLEDEIQAVKEGRRQTAEEHHAAFRKRHNLPDLSHLTADELADKADQAIAAMDPEARSALERDGWL